MKRMLSLICIIGLAITFFVGCSSDNDALSQDNTDIVTEATGTETDKNIDTDTNISTETTIEATKEITEESNPDEALLDNIIVTYRPDTIMENGKQRIIIDIENKSPKVFTGDIRLRFKDNNGKSLGYDIAIVEDLGVGKKTWCNVYITPSDNINFSYEFASGYKFTETVSASDGVLDEELSQSLSKMMYEGFGGFGNPELATSWYQYIKQLEVYKSGSEYYAVAIVTTNDETAIDRIGNAVLFNFRDVSLSEILVKDEAGNILFQKSK